jgi:Flp pilus assembly pilin Flp
VQLKGRNQSGQAVVEYIILLSMAVAIALAMAAGFNGISKKLWQLIACEVSAPCPGCQVDEAVKNALSPGVCQ